MVYVKNVLSKLSNTVQTQRPVGIECDVGTAPEAEGAACWDLLKFAGTAPLPCPGSSGSSVGIWAARLFPAPLGGC